METYTIEELLSDLKWWEKWLEEIPVKYKDRPAKIKSLTKQAHQKIARCKKLIADKRAGRGDRDKKEEEALRRKKARGIPTKKK